jgi:hypothetical protein
MPSVPNPKPLTYLEQLTAQACSSVIVTFLFFYSMRACRQAFFPPFTSILPCHMTGCRRQLLVRASISIQVTTHAAPPAEVLPSSLFRL